MNKLTDIEAKEIRNKVKMGIPFPIAVGPERWSEIQKLYRRLGIKCRKG